jgi:acyl-[acyl-carrier-protein]-phospholipid O-acyltransferase/long-chain-fatty-acid--[acyl-carrier-protein] ligase
LRDKNEAEASRRVPVTEMIMDVLKTVFRWLLRLLYGFKAYNEPVLGTKGPVLLLSNHVSWWDWLFLGVCLENDWRFVTSSRTAELSWLHRAIMVNRRTFPVDMNSPYAVKHIASYLQRGGRLVMFPEGRISTTGSLMKLFEGTGFLLGRTKAKVITAFIRGADCLPLSHNPRRKEWLPRVSLHLSPVLTPPKGTQAHPSEARAAVTDWLWDQMVRQQFETEMSFGPPTVPLAIVRTARKMRRRIILQDSTLKEITYGQVLTGAAVLSAQWRSLLTASHQRVGVLLPNVNGCPLVLLSLWMNGRIPAILNYTIGPASLLACARLAKLKHIITSRKFVERAGLDLRPLQSGGIELVFIEDVRAGISFLGTVKGMLHSRLCPERADKQLLPEETALILFTSGSEGEPKGVELTHQNILANVRQMLSVIDLMETDRFFNALPLFHSFGLTVGLLLPLIQGTFVLLYLSPLHYRIVPAAFYNLNCTVLFGTNTFLAGYARKAHPYDFHTLRYVFAGAEKLQKDTVSAWMQKFGVRVLEGYGATECGPCLSVNVPMHSRPESAGRFLPGIEFRLEPVEGIDFPESENSTLRTPQDSALRPPHSTLDRGRLFVRGPNIMRGYLNPEPNANFQALKGWYDTGDIARVDPAGFVYILGRLKRFAKVSGEMISLTSVEETLQSAFPEYGHHFGIAVVAIPDKTRGEKLIAVTNEPKLTLAQIREAVRAHGMSALAAPRELKLLAELPRLGSGKLNHRELQERLKADQERLKAEG